MVDYEDIINSVLNEKEKKIICLRYGLSSDFKKEGKEHALFEISEITGLTRERIRQIIVKSLQKIVKYIY